VKALTISAASSDSARSLLEALSPFDATIVVASASLEVSVPLRGAQDIIPVLNAIEQYVNNRADGPAHIRLDGNVYSLYPAPVQ
jgi:hypothetical protein